MKLTSNNEEKDGQDNLPDEQPADESVESGGQEIGAEAVGSGSEGSEFSAEANEAAEESVAEADEPADDAPASDASDSDVDGLKEEDQAAEEAEADDNVEDSDALESVTEAEAGDDSGDDGEQIEADVEFEGDRPLVKELVYQAPRGKQNPEDQEEAESLKFGSVGEAKTVVEGFLFSCNEPLTVNKLSKLMNNLHPKTVRGLLLELQWDYENRPGALQIVEIAGGYQMCTRTHVAPWMFRMHKHKRRSALSPATLETLAIVAYRQPITKGEIETIRGVESGAPLRTLQDLNLVEASGRREVIGRPQLYVTTEQFLKTFGLKSVADLPSISELKNRFAEETKIKRVVAEEPKPEVRLDSNVEALGEIEASADEARGDEDEGQDAATEQALANSETAESEDQTGGEPAELAALDEDLDDLDDLDYPDKDEDALIHPEQKKAQGRFEEEDSLDIP